MFIVKSTINQFSKCVSLFLDFRGHYNNKFALCFFVLFTLVAIGISNVDADGYAPYKYEGKDVYVKVHGNAEGTRFQAETSVHVHAIAYVSQSSNSGASQTSGNYTILLEVTEPEKEKVGTWGI